MVTRLRGYTNFFKQNFKMFSTVPVTVTSVTWLRLRLRTHGERVAQLQSSLVTRLRGYAIFVEFFSTFFLIFSQLLKKISTFSQFFFIFLTFFS